MLKFLDDPPPKWFIVLWAVVCFGAVIGALVYTLVMGG